VSDEEERIHSIDEQASRLDRLEAKLDQLLGTGSKVHAEAEAHTERKLDRPSEVKEQVRMELARAKQEEAAAAEAEKDKSERQTIREQLAKLTEAKPEAPQPRRQRVMWGPR
jgi:hypothetical protein